MKKKLGVLEALGTELGRWVPRMGLEQDVLRAISVESQAKKQCYYGRVIESVSGVGFIE